MTLWDPGDRQHAFCFNWASEFSWILRSYDFYGCSCHTPISTSFWPCSLDPFTSKYNPLRHDYYAPMVQEILWKLAYLTTAWWKPLTQPPFAVQLAASSLASTVKPWVDGLWGGLVLRMYKKNVELDFQLQYGFGEYVCSPAITLDQMSTSLNQASHQASHLPATGWPSKALHPHGSLASPMPSEPFPSDLRCAKKKRRYKDHHLTKPGPCGEMFA